MKYFALLLLLPAAIHAQLLTNPGFESGADGWKINEKEQISSVVEDAAHEGKYGLRINDESREGTANIASDRFPVSAGQKVKISFMGRSGADNLGAVMLVPYTSSNRAILDEKGKPTCVIPIRKGSGDWEHYEAEYVVPDEATEVGISIRTWTGSTGTADLDNFDLKIE